MRYDYLMLVLVLNQCERSCCFFLVILVLLPNGMVLVIVVCIWMCVDHCLILFVVLNLMLAGVSGGDVLVGVVEWQGR